MTAGSSITSVAALALIEAVAQRGKPVEPLFELASLDPTPPPDVDRHVPAERYFERWDRAMQLVQDPSFPVRVGASFDLEELEVFGFLAMACETLRDAYERTARVRSLYNVGSRWELEVDDERMRMTWSPWPIKVHSELGRRSVNEYQVSEMLACVRQMTERRLVPQRIAFRHPRRDRTGLDRARPLRRRQDRSVRRVLRPAHVAGAARSRSGMTRSSRTLEAALRARIPPRRGGALRPSPTPSETGRGFPRADETRRARPSC